MHSVQTGMWDPQPPSKHASPLPRPPEPNPRPAHVTTAAPAKRITFYKSGDSQFAGVRMAVHKRSFKCFDALLDDLSQKVSVKRGLLLRLTCKKTHFNLFILASVFALFLSFLTAFLSSLTEQSCRLKEFAFCKRIARKVYLYVYTPHADAVAIWRSHRDHSPRHPRHQPSGAAPGWRLLPLLGPAAD